MDWGYHLTEDLCKKLQKATHDFKKFGMVLSKSTEMDSLSGESLLEVMSNVAPSLPEHEMLLMNSIRLKR